MNLIFTPRMIVALAALLASTLVAACGLRSTNPSTETLTIYQDAPKMKLLDLGEPGNSPGDVYHFFAPLHSSPGGPVIGEVFGSKTLVKLATDGNPNLEQRTTLLSFTFSDRQDQIIALGVADYSPTAGEFNPSQPRARAILGGTGKYMGARGQLTSTRNADGSYTQVFTLLK
ncbi:MAG: hypothetical protein DME67_05150 [Verrucomicrobia bacterium]|nr:MAG: hypothetical protein DME67_05150 [Verrucomicrobiota bacterium]